MTTEQRLIELETKVAFQEDTIQSLSDTLARQQFELEKLQRLTQDLRTQMQSNQTMIRDLQQEVPPPHY